ncbi:MAG: flagellar basal body-associated FliL family protein [Alphaproteobacteria bacterium]|nr:flagellar basal body-associated FliL family protein [Alphaproteobacteria bacterium]MBX9977438.1 flagellar basal body-associated FliL family protein [Alphaproteobacteria bacterium]
MSEKNKEENKNVEDAEIIDEKKGSNKLVLILIPLLTIVGVCAGVFLGPTLKSMLGMGRTAEKGEGSHPEKKETGHEGAEDSGGDNEPVSKKPAVDPKLITFIPVPDVLVNLKTDNKSRPVFLKVSIALEIHDPHEKEAVEALRPKVVDQMQLFLRDLDVADVTGANNLQRLRRELHMRVNNVTSPIKVDDVLIKDFLVQ